MRTEYLYEFIALTKYGNFQIAADSLFISQSSLSKHIQSIESELGVALLRHNKNKFSLTPEGMDFLPYAVKICDLRNEYTELFKNRGNSRKLDIGTCHFSSVEDELFSNAILKFSLEFPDCLIRTPPVMSTDNLEEMLIENEHGKVPCLIAKTISNDMFKEPSYLKTKTLFQWPVSVLTRTDHPLANGNISLESLSEETLISLAYPTFANALTVKAFRSAGLIPIFSYTLNSLQNIFDFVKNKKGIYIVTEPVKTSSLPEGLCLTEITPTIKSETFITHNSQFTHDYELRFLEILEEEFSGALDKN